MELDALRIEGITRGGELPCEQLEAIAKQSSFRKSSRPARGPNSWNNFVKDMQQKLPSESKEFGLNTRYLSTLWSQLSADKKLQYRRGRRPQMKSKAQLRHAISHLRKEVEEISNLGADILLFVCDNKKRSEGGGHSSAIGSPQAVRFTQWMEKHRVGFIDFKRFCKGEELFLSHHGERSLEEFEDGLLSRLNKEDLATLSRDESRSQLNTSLLLMFNKAVGHQDKLQRLPQTKNWAQWMERRGLNLVIETPNITRSDLEERQGKIGIAKVKAMISGIRKGDIRFQNI
ncbi:MAG: hypothetical protein M1824_002796 [Vezdaea acicularis]|nr:MAG: hypothetical protein M1824_002796 [Vezdaea acicularis]